MKKHIFLTGFMGAGKSRIGGALAKRLRRLFFDSDLIIENEYGLSISDIFQVKGEASFREIESRIVQMLSCNATPSVIALGGGALLNKANREVAQENGLLIYLKSAPQAIMRRIKDSNKRPLLRVDHPENYEDELLRHISALLAAREEIYEQSDIIFDRDGLEATEVVDQLIRQIDTFWERKSWNE